jgi:transposase
MITDSQVKLLIELVKRKGMTIKAAAAKAAMSESSAHKYFRSGKFPSELKAPYPPRTHRTRVDAFAGVWAECLGYLAGNPGLEVKALFAHLQRKYPGQFKPGQLRTLQRRVKQWRGDQPKEVYFEQVYRPGDRSQSDFTCMNHLGVTLRGEPFPHLVYHFVLAYSNWASAMICKSESFDALSAGLQKALFALGGVPRLHQTDSMSCAVRNHRGRDRGSFTARYQALMDHYGMDARRTQPRRPHENGKIEQRHHRLKRALGNQLILRGSRDFDSREDYVQFLDQLITQLNAPRQARFDEERAELGALPAARLDGYQRVQVRVSKGSTILVQKNHYSVSSTLIGRHVEVRVYAQRIEVWHAQRCQDQMPRLHGDGKHRIQYRHVIRMLVRKPGAFAHYRYRADLFPTHTFRRAYDVLKRTHTRVITADKVYLRILHLAATVCESGVEAALERLLASPAPMTEEAVQDLLEASQMQASNVDLCAYDALLMPQSATGGLR